MVQRVEFLKDELIGKIAQLAGDRLDPGKASKAQSFIRQLYANVAPDDLSPGNPEQLYGAAMSLWLFMRKRPPLSPKIRVYNPQLEEHGWTSDHTVIEIINDDMPFLVDSVTSELTRKGMTVHSVIHPIMAVRREPDGSLIELVGEGGETEGTTLESVMRLEVDQQAGGERLAKIASDLEKILQDVRDAVADWPLMLGRAMDVVHELETSNSPQPAEEVDEVRDFVRWLHDSHFTFLGYRLVRFGGAYAKPTVSHDHEANLGILRSPEARIFDEQRSLADMPVEVRTFLLEPELLMITKSGRLSSVHRPVHMDLIGVKRYDDQGRVIGMHLFAGLFTSVAYTRSPGAIPMLRQKVERTIDRAGFRPFSHDGKALRAILDSYPRDELFQISDDQLFDISMGILHLQERQRVALFVRRDRIERFVSCLVYVPRDRYDTALRLRIQAMLEESFQGKVSAYYTQVVDSPLARLHFIVSGEPGTLGHPDLTKLESRLAEAARSWTDHLRDALIAAHGEEQGIAQWRRFAHAFPASYRETQVVQSAVADIDRIETVLNGAPIAMTLYRPIEAGENEAHFKLYNAEATIALSDVLPMLENMGLRVIGEVPHYISPEDGQDVWIHDFGMATNDGASVDIGHVRDRFQQAFARVWANDAENDGFNQLILRAGLHWREVMLLRAYAKYLRQTGFTFSQQSLERALAVNGAVTCQIVALFHALFDPDHQDQAKAEAARESIAELLDKVADADDDRILRRFLNLVDSTLRTNFYQQAQGGGPKPYVSLKLDSGKVEDLPLPRPFVEVFVYSPRVEAIHLRGGKVARGGIRWSDRREDFRSEVLGLVKAQMVKNAVIVPVGAKGGFVVKQPPAGGGREAVQAEGIACYQTLMRGLLDITDNLVAGEIVPPRQVVRRDDDDPYLVVAADKGTATFSDIANAISLEYGHWLGDAFASGGSKGYDHKAMGITARGAWVAVQRHFREIGIDTQSQPFTTVGVGDMSGDVFGNGMLRSPHTKLVAAFNHMHIFLDPNPDPAKSFAERERLFNLPRSTWADYDNKLISPGGGVHPRSAKTLPLTPEVKQLLNLTVDTITPNDLIKAILKAQVDLLWFGGIGTYVKATQESQAEAGDRTNEALRINGRDIRAKIVGEGANLGFTQLGRIEYALAGGRINTDAIDNSAGVDTSDHEVNIKILLNKIVSDGDMTGKQRDELLAAMTDEVADHVLRDNYLQTQALTKIEARASSILDQHVRLMRMLERAGRLNRAVEYLPDDEKLTERAAKRQGLTRPEIAVVFAYSKIWLYDQLIASDLPDDPRLGEELDRYFPNVLCAKFSPQIREHRLKRDIIATTTTNSMINRVGGTFVTEMVEKTGMNPVDIARAYIVTRDAYGLRNIWEAIEALDNKVPAELQTDMLLEVDRLIERSVAWVLRYAPTPVDIGATIADLAPGIAELHENLGAILPKESLKALKDRTNQLTKRGTPADLAHRVASLIVLASANDVVRIAQRKDISVTDAARLYFATGTTLGLGWLRSAAEHAAESGNHWNKLAVAAIIEELYAHQRDITIAIAERAGAVEPDKAIALWTQATEGPVERARGLIEELRSAGSVDLAMLAVANRQLRSLCDS